MSAQAVSIAAPVRAEIGTAAPFQSVKELAATRFGGFGFWRPTASHNHSEHNREVVDITKLEEETAQLEKDLILKEREAFDVLKELESTKLIVEELKLKVQKETSDVNAVPVEHSGDLLHPATELPEKENHQNPCPFYSPGLVLLELKQAKVNLSRTTKDLADIRATIESYTRKIEEERISLEKTCQRLYSNASNISTLEEEINQTRQKLQMAKDARAQAGSDVPMTRANELQVLSSETGQVKKMGEAARSEILKIMSEIEEGKSRLKTAEIRLVAAKKLKETARANEAVAQAEIKALSNRANVSGASQQNLDVITLDLEEYVSLTSKAREGEEISKMRVKDAMLQVDEAITSKVEILNKVEEAVEEVKTKKKALEEALSRVEAANKGKSAVEETLHKWRSERGEKRRIVHNATKFKNAATSQHRKDSALFDVNSMNAINDGLKRAMNPALSIGQILRRKLLLTKGYENGIQEGKPSGERQVSHAFNKRIREKKFGLARISFLVTKQSKKKKKKKKKPSMSHNSV